MAVHTKLTKEEIANHLKSYSNQIKDEFVDFKEIIEGIDNSNFLIITKNNKYILTLFESRIDKQFLDFFINFKLHLTKNNICCPKPITNNQGRVICDLKNKKSTIVSFLEGEILRPNNSGLYDNIKTEHCFELGLILAKMHLASSTFDSFKENDLGVKNFRNFYKKFDKNEYYNNSIFIHEIIKELEENWNNNLPSGVVHVDLFPDNVFFKEDKISGVIDFYFSANDLFIYDIAVCVNAWCFDEKIEFCENKFYALLNGYQQIRTLSKQEKNFINYALLAASTRFFLTRLHDKIFTNKDSVVKIKNPDEYLKKIEFFKKEKYDI